MKKLIIFVLLIGVLGLIGCSFIVREQQVMYNGKIYAYDEMGFVDVLPERYALVGSVKQTSDSKIPTKDWHGCRVVVGQNVFASDLYQNEIYLEFKDGYAKFIVLSAAQ